MIEISRGKFSEYDETIDFIDYVFSMASDPHHFPRRAPVLYRETEEAMHNFINLREDGIIKASLLCYPRTLCVGEAELKLCGIGSVATHPRARNRGFMTMIMDYATREMEEQGVHLAYLGGDRGRYNRFGYEMGGNSYSISLSLRALKGKYPNYDASKYEFRPLQRDETDVLEKLLAIYNQKSWHYVYNTEDFYLRMIRSGAAPITVYEDGEVVGFIDLYTKKSPFTVDEIRLADDMATCDVLFSYMIQKNAEIHCRIAFWQLEHFKEMIEIAGREISLQSSRQWKVLDWQEVLRALFEFKAGFAPLLAGILVVDIDGRKLSISYDGKNTVVEPTDGRADLSFPGLSAIRGLLGSVPEAVMEPMEDAKLYALVKNWFPLSLSLFGPESV